MEGIHRKSYSDAMIEEVRKRARVFVGNSIVRTTDRVLNKGDGRGSLLAWGQNTGDN